MILGNCSSFFRQSILQFLGDVSQRSHDIIYTYIYIPRMRRIYAFFTYMNSWKKVTWTRGKVGRCCLHGASGICLFSILTVFERDKGLDGKMCLSWNLQISFHFFPGKIMCHFYKKNRICFEFGGGIIFSKSCLTFILRKYVFYFFHLFHWVRKVCYAGVCWMWKVTGLTFLEIRVL